jgi:site-specific DNA recombinase
MTTKTAVALYARISQDRSGDELGVSRQLKDCRAEAKRRGWSVAEEYVDDDVSAYSGKRRPAYERMLADIADGLRDGVIVWHMDRLHRRPLELEHFVSTCTRAGLNDVVTLHGDIDLAKGDGLLMARLLAAVAANESDSKRRRGARKALEIAESGAPFKGGPRPYGFKDDRVTHEPAEAEIIRETASRILAGESLQSVVNGLNSSGARTSMGNEWRTGTVKNVMTAPRYWGMRIHQGQVIGPATWEGIITAEQGERLRLLFNDPARRTNRAARRYLLSGLLRCGLCGGKLYACPKNGVPRYGCHTGADLRGCGRIYIYAGALEQLIADAVLLRLDSPDLVATLTRADDGAHVRTLGDAISADTARMDDLAAAWADGEFSRQEWKVARDRLEARVESNRRELMRLTKHDALANYMGHGAQLREQWDSLNLSRQVAIVRAIVDHIVINPATRATNRLDPSRVAPVWRL